MHRIIRSFTLAMACTLCLAAVALAGHGEHKPTKKGILLVAFGTSIPEAQHALDNIVDAAKKAFPGVEIRWAWTSHIIREKVAKEQGLHVDSESVALAKMLDDGFTDVAVQSLHTIPGAEYHDMVKAAHAYRALGMRTLVGYPLMATSEDLKLTAEAIIATIPQGRKKNEAVVLLGHGTHHPADVYYSAVQHVLAGMDELVLMGTVEGHPTYDDVLATLKAKGVKKVWLMPFMSVAGDHIVNDMAGPEADSWASMLAAEGIKNQSVLKGTAEYDEYVDIWIDHLKGAFSHFR